MTSEEDRKSLKRCSGKKRIVWLFLAGVVCVSMGFGGGVTHGNLIKKNHIEKLEGQRVSANRHLEKCLEDNNKKDARHE